MGWEIAEGSGKWKKITKTLAKKHITDYIRHTHGFESKQGIESTMERLVKKNGKEMINISTTFTNATFIRYVDGVKK